MYSKSFPISTTLSATGELVEQAATKAKYNRDYNGQSYEFYSQPQGVVYINSGSASGWKLFNVVDHNADLIDVADRGYVMYTAITVDDDDMLVQTYTIDGNYASVPYHSFGITKAKINDKPISGGDDDNNGGDNQPVNPSQNSLPTWAIAIIAVGSVLVAGGVAVAVIFAVKKRKKSDN